MNFVEHIGIAVNNIESANELYTALLGVAPYKMETVESERVMTSFFKWAKIKSNYLRQLMKIAPLQSSLQKRRRHTSYCIRC